MREGQNRKEKGKKRERNGKERERKGEREGSQAMKAQAVWYGTGCTGEAGLARL
jgi:hypothetical protein